MTDRNLLFVENYEYHNHNGVIVVTATHLLQ